MIYKQIFILNKQFKPICNNNPNSKSLLTWYTQPGTTSTYLKLIKPTVMLHPRTSTQPIIHQDIAIDMQGGDIRGEIVFLVSQVNQTPVWQHDHRHTDLEQRDLLAICVQLDHRLPLPANGRNLPSRKCHPPALPIINVIQTFEKQETERRDTKILGIDHHEKELLLQVPVRHYVVSGEY